MFDCVWSDTLHEYNYLTFDKYEVLNKYDKALLSRPLYKSEKATWYSHSLLWIKCAMENKDIAIIEHDVECVAPLDFEKRGLNIFSNYDNESEWKHYANRFTLHPYWGHRNKLVPFTHAYTLTPKIATELLAMLQPVVFKGFADDLLLKYKLEKECDNSLDKVKESVYNYTKPIINHKVGNTIDHGHVGF